MKKFIYILISIVLIIPVSAQNNLDNSGWTISSSTLNTLPFRGGNNLYYTLFSGVTSQDFRGNDLLHIRGSRYDELAYYINGIDIRSDYTGLPLFRIIPQALDNITIDKAPGVGKSSSRAAITHELKQGGDDYTFSINGETDKFTPLYEKRLDTYSYGYNNLTLTGGGTIPKLGTEIFIAGEKESFDDYYRMFWDGFHITDEDMDLTFITNTTWTEVDTGYVYSFDVLEDMNEILVRPGNITSANLGRTTFNGVITQPFLNGSVSLIALYEDETKQINNTPIFHMFNQKRLPETNRKAQLYSLQGEYNFPMDYKLSLQVDFMRSSESTYDPTFGSDFWKYSDSTALVQAGIPYVSGYGNMQVNNFYFSKPGREIVGYSKQNENYNNFKFELSKSINNHFIRIGGNYKISEYRFFSLNPWTMRNVQGNLRFNGFTVKDAPRAVLDRTLFLSRVQGVGYNLLGEKITDESTYYDAPIQPKQASFYISDIITKGDWIAEIGLRYDSINSDSQVYKDSAVVEPMWYYFNDPWNWHESLVKQNKQTEWSPRIKVEHATSENLHSYINIGKYVQFPQYKDVFTSKMYRGILTSGQNFISDLRAWNAKPVVSFQSSLGLQYIYSERVFVNAELYNVSTKNYLQSGNKTLITYDSPTLHPGLTSDGKTTTNGLELNINYNTEGVEAWINYNFSAVKGTGPYPISNYWYTWIADWDSTKILPKNREFEYNSKHSVAGFVSKKYGNDKNWVLKNTTISALGRFDSGHPYTLWEAGWG